MSKKRVASRKIRPWSIGTTVRNPARIAAFLRILKDHLEGKTWDASAQIEYQIRLIQHRYYGAFNHQFYQGLSDGQIALIESGQDIDYEEAKRISECKKFKDFPMRGRTSFKPLQKFGFAGLTTDKKIKITMAGHALLERGETDVDLFLRSFLKWQIPNHLDRRGFPANMGYCLKPFISTLHLIKKVNLLCKERGLKEVGISQTELGVFALTMIKWDEAERVAEEIVDFRSRFAEQSNEERGRRRTESLFALPEQQTNNPWERDQCLIEQMRKLRPDFDMKNVADYADNTVRYFRISGLLHLRGAGRFIDLEPIRRVEIEALLDQYSGKPDSLTDSEYSETLGDHTKPLLPWETHRELERTAVSLIGEIESIEGEGFVAREDYSNKPIAEMKELVRGLRDKRNLIVSERAKRDMEDPEKIQEIIDQLNTITRSNTSGMQKSLALEWLVTSGLIALDDAEEIRPNYPKGDDGMPRAHAPGGKPDIECFYEGFCYICEVTMIRDRSQWIKEGQPVMRHLRDFEDGRNKGEEVYGVFIAPSIHRDTINTFWTSVRHEYEGMPQKIVPLTIAQFCMILAACKFRRVAGRPISKAEIVGLLKRLVELTLEVESSKDWIKQIEKEMSSWVSDTQVEQ